MSILGIYERFSFSILPCTLDVARNEVAMQLADWGKSVSLDRLAPRNVRLLYDSPQGPFHPPAVKVAVLLSEIGGPRGKNTVFVSSVAGGYFSLVTMISQRIPGHHLSFSISRLDVTYPRNAIIAVEKAEVVRAVHAMRETRSWEFFEVGTPLPFEEPNFYRARLKRERLTPQIIADYLARFGYGSLDEDFWISSAPAHLICETGFEIGQV